MSKAVLQRSLQRSSFYPMRNSDARNSLDNLLESMYAEIKETGKCVIPGFGTFAIKQNKARQGVNPRTREKIDIPASKTIKFQLSPVLRKRIQIGAKG